MKLYRRVKAVLLITLVLATAGTVLSIVNSIVNGVKFDFLPIGMFYAVITYGFIALKKEKKALDEETK